MRYFIGCLIKGEVKDCHEKLVEKICSKFNVRNLNTHVLAHFTLKSPFVCDDVSDVEVALENFCSEKKNIDIILDDIGSFNEYVIFLDGKFPFEGEKIFRDLINELRNIDWMQFRDYEFDKVHFHATLARAKDKRQFGEIMGFLKDEDFDMNVCFDNLTIFEKVSGKWRVYREFEFGN